MNSPDKFGIGQAGQETPVSPPPVETRPEPALPQEGKRPQEEPNVVETRPELVIEAPPQEEVTPAAPVAATPEPITPSRIGEHDLSGDIDIAAAAALQEEISH